MPNRPDRVITSADAAKILGVSVSTAQLWITREILPSWRTPGGHRRLYVGDVMALAARLKSAGGEAEPLPPEFLPVATEQATSPSFEAERLSAVHQSKLIDTPAEETFDRITGLASHICDCPMALITLLTSARQWFKSRKGIDISETSRDDAFCSYAILARSPLIVEDAILDPRFSKNRLVLGSPYIRFYAGFPIYGIDELPLGTLCVLDTEPRKLRVREMESMFQLSNIVSEELIRRSHSTIQTEFDPSNGT